MAHASQWKPAGRISLWRYTENERNYSGWHINADRDGCESLLTLLDLLPRDVAPYRTVAITPPTDDQLRVPNNRGAAWLAPSALRVRMDADPTLWRFPAELAPGTLTIGSQWLEPLRLGVCDMAGGRGDYSIGDRKASLPLWFWWSVHRTEYIC